MSLLESEIKRAVKDVDDAFTEFRTRQDRKVASMASAVTEMLETVKGQQEVLNGLVQFKDAVEDEQSRSRAPSRGGMSAAHKAFNQYLHTGKLEQLDAKDISISGGESAGAGMVPTAIASSIQDVAVDEEPILDEILVTESTTGDYRRVTNRKGSNSGWVGETDARGGTDTSGFRNIEPPGGELYAYPAASDWAVQTMAFNVAQLIIADAGEEFAAQQADALFFGNGSNKPLGMLYNTPVTTADTTPDTRDKDTLRYLQSSASPNALDADLLISALFDLKASYRRNAIWCMNSFTLGQVRSLKDLNGRYIWESGGFGAGIDAPDGLLLGKRVVVSEQLQNVGVGAGNFPILVGDFRRGYELVKVGAMRITLDSNLTSPGFVKWYIRQRFLGRLTDNNAIRAIRT